MHQRCAAWDAACICGRARFEFGTTLHKDPGHFNIAVARGGHQRRLAVARQPVDRRPGINERFRDCAGARQAFWEPESLVVKADHGDVVERVGAEPVVGPVDHRADR